MYNEDRISVYYSLKFKHLGAIKWVKDLNNDHALYPAVGTRLIGN